MPDPSDTHDADIDLTPGTAKSDIVAVLYGNPGNRFSTDGIQDRLDIPHTTVTATLTRLNNDGLIGKTEGRNYHALDHRDDLRRYVGSLNQLETMFDDKHTNRDDFQLKDIDEDELDTEIVKLEADLNQE
ncbi:MarR family transcriptional regulator [Halorussus gelatinilyticus]|uniref:MarR family transcriptional regulator n=1 Tax=Halorussus gelatinilyticus TaxID=2937524 RepID=A0A8U0IKR9_9EURY|nr:MarR family transcriptional regulator [Halorussus gelatinilyticus]UPW01703.1 MarR family transcriptional regulator [Halorussus gelatinilyticus]